MADQDKEANMEKKVTRIRKFGARPKEAGNAKIRCGCYVRVSTATEFVNFLKKVA